MFRWTLGLQWLGAMAFLFTYKWGITWGYNSYNPLILTFDPNFQRDILAPSFGFVPFVVWRVKMVSLLHKKTQIQGEQILDIN